MEEAGGGGKRTGVYGNSILSAQFFCEPKTALKDQILKKVNRFNSRPPLSVQCFTETVECFLKACCCFIALCDFDRI